MLLNKKIPLYYIFNKIKLDLLIILGVSLLVQSFKSRFLHVLPDMPIYIPTLLGTSISILLSFKMSQSYDRWWEARKIWGSIVNDSRTLVLQLQGFVQNDEQTIKKLANRQIAFSYALGQSLREVDVMQYSGSFLSEQDKAQLATHRNIPLAILQMNVNDIKMLKEAGKIDTLSHIQLDSTLVRLVDSMGKAERIKSTIFPSTYRIFLHFIIYIFVITLSIALDNIDSLFELPLLLVIASCFFLIEKSAFHLQDPFNNRPSDISVTAIARTIEINIKQLQGETDVPEPWQPNGFYLM